MTTDSKNKHYIALVVMEICNNTLGKHVLYREDIVLCKDSDLESARSTVEKLAKKEQVTYKNGDNEEITLRFLKIQDISEIDQDSILYSRHFRDIGAYNLVNTID